MRELSSEEIEAQIVENRKARKSKRKLTHRQASEKLKHWEKEFAKFEESSRDKTGWFAKWHRDYLLKKIAESKKQVSESQQ